MDSHPQDVDSHPPDTDPHPQDMDSHPQDMDSHPQDMDSHPQDMDLHPPDTDPHPQDMDSHPQDMDLHLQDTDPHLQDMNSHPQDMDSQPHDMDLHPQHMDSHPQDQTKDDALRLTSKHLCESKWFVSRVLFLAWRNFRGCSVQRLYPFSSNFDFVYKPKRFIDDEPYLRMTLLILAGFIDTTSIKNLDCVNVIGSMKSMNYANNILICSIRSVFVCTYYKYCVNCNLE
jgi:hypothetical protein